MSRKAKDYIISYFLSDPNVINLANALNAPRHTKLIKEYMLVYTEKFLTALSPKEPVNFKSCILALNVDFVKRVKERSIHLESGNYQVNSTPMRPQEFIPPSVPVQSFPQHQPYLQPPRPPQPPRIQQEQVPMTTSTPLSLESEEDEDEEGEEDEDAQSNNYLPFYSSPLDDVQEDEESTELSFSTPVTIPVHYYPNHKEDVAVTPPVHHPNLAVTYNKAPTIQSITQPRKVISEKNMSKTFDLAGITNNTITQEMLGSHVTVDKVIVQIKEENIHKGNNKFHFSEDNEEMVTIEIQEGKYDMETLRCALTEKMNSKSLKYRYTIDLDSGKVVISQTALANRSGTFSLLIAPMSILRTLGFKAENAYKGKSSYVAENSHLLDNKSKTLKLEIQDGEEIVEVVQENMVVWTGTKPFNNGLKISDPIFPQKSINAIVTLNFRIPSTTYIDGQPTTTDYKKTSSKPQLPLMDI